MKILIVENQVLQYKKLMNYFNEKQCDVYPKKDRYHQFIDKVRIWSNDQYKIHIRNSAENELIAQMKEISVDILVVDYILGGAHYCKTGIDFVEQFYVSYKLCASNLKKILFLSNVISSNKSVVIKFNELKKMMISNEAISVEWVQKGYFGDEELDEEYFFSQVYPKLNINELDYKKQLEKIIRESKMETRPGNKRYEIIEKLKELARMLSSVSLTTDLAYKINWLIDNIDEMEGKEYEKNIEEVLNAKN